MTDALRNQVFPTNKPSLQYLAEPVKALIRALAGDDRSAILYSSRRSAESFLGDPDPNVRWSALQVLATHWGPDDTLRTACERLLTDDPDAVVRQCALQILTVCYEGTNDKERLSALAKMVYETSHPAQMRLSAYYALLAARDGTSAPGRLLDSCKIHFLEEVDWHFVDSFLY